MSTSARSNLVERGPVNLGCGTLILIALIVLFFSNRGQDRAPQFENQIRRLESQMGTLQDSLQKVQNSFNDQAATLSRIEQQIQQIENGKGAATQSNAPAKR